MGEDSGSERTDTGVPPDEPGRGLTDWKPLSWCASRWLWLAGSKETSGGLAERLPSEAEECDDDEAGRLLELLLAVPTIESMEKPILGLGGLTTGGEEELVVTTVAVEMGEDLLLALCSSIALPNWLMLLLLRPLKCIKW